jgi:hypothetical protein
MTGITKFDAAVSLIGDTGSVATVDGNDISTFYYQGCVAPDASEINAKQIELQVAWDAQEYARSRKAEYDALNQLELMSDDAINGTTTHKDAIVAIKTKYPKV